MIKHIVCFKLIDRKECERAKGILKSMMGVVPEVREISVNIDELHTSRSYDLILEVVVDSWEALDSYQNDSYHCEVVKTYIHSVRKESIALDFEV